MAIVIAYSKFSVRNILQIVIRYPVKDILEFIEVNWKFSVFTMPWICRLRISFYPQSHIVLWKRWLFGIQGNSLVNNFALLNDESKYHLKTFAQFAVEFDAQH